MDIIGEFILLESKLNGKFDFNRIKSDFYSYLIKKGDQESADNLIASDTSIFTLSSDFKDFIQEEGAQYNLPTGFNGNITDLEKLQFDEENQEFTTDSENNENSIFTGLLNNLIQDENIKNQFDSDGNGKLSEKEMTEFLDSLKDIDENQDDLSLDDIFGMYSKYSADEAPALTLNAPSTADATPASTSGNPTSSSTGNNSSSPSTYNPNNYQNNTENTQQEKTLDNMSKEELKSELSKANSELSSNNDKLNSLLDGSDSTLKTMQDDTNKLFTEYQDKLKLVDVELANKSKDIEGKISDKESQINNKDIDISNKKNDVSKAENELSSATSERECLEQSLSNLKATDTSKMEASKKQEIEKKINELENVKIPAAKDKEAAKKEKLQNEKDALSSLETEKTSLEEQLTALKEDKRKLDNDIATKYPEVKESQTKYNESKTKYDEYKASEVSKAQEAVKTSQDRVKEVQSALDKAENKETENNYKVSGLQSTYNLNGTNFNVVGMEGFNTLEEFQNFILEKGMTNKGKGGNDWPMQCHNFSNEYGDIMLGTSKIDLNSADAAAQAAKGKDRQFKNVYCDTYDAAYSVIAAELDAGRPVVARIRTPGKNMNHYGLICGIREGADRNNLKQSDFLYIDSYGGTISYLGKTRELIGCQGSVHVWQGKDYNFEYKDQSTYSKRYKSAEEVRKAYGLA